METEKYYERFHQSKMIHMLNALKNVNFATSFKK